MDSSSFTFRCPEDWSKVENKNYGGNVDLVGCSKIYSGDISFDDGISVTFGYVSNELADGYIWDGEKWAQTILNAVKEETNSQEYSKDNFYGWLSMKQPNRHTLKLIARYDVNGGYYETEVEAQGDTKTDTEFLQFADDIISTFEEK